MRLGCALALLAVLSAGATTNADDCCGLRCVSHCLQTGYSDDAPSVVDQEYDELLKELRNPPPIPDDDSQSTTPSWGVFPRLPGLRGVRGLTGVIGNLMQTNPHVGGTWYATEPVSNQPTNMGMNREFFQVAAPVWSNGKDTLVLSSHVQVTNVQTSAILPTSGTPFPNQLWNIWFGMNYFHTFDNGITGAMLLEGGSASDKPFDTRSNDSAAGTGLLIIPQNDRDAWIVGVQASTNSQVLYGIPLPGVAYLYNPDDYFQSIIGFPYNAINYRPSEFVQLQLLYMFLTTVHARASYQPTNDWQIYAGFDWTNENYFLSGIHQSSDERFFYYEKRIVAGWQWWWAKHFALELAAGYAFNRYFVSNNGFSFSLSGTNRVDVGSGPFVTLQLDYRF
jgi:hypothetical protein